MSFLENLALYCRVFVGILFFISSLGKLKNFSAFKESVHNFGILPSLWEHIFAMLFILLEGLIVLFMTVSGVWILLGFIISICIICIFSVAIIVVLLKHKNISCNCFGAHDKIVAPHDLLRNFSIMCISILGLLIRSAYIQQTNVDVYYFTTTLAIALISIIIILNLEVIFFVFRRPVIS